MIVTNANAAVLFDMTTPRSYWSVGTSHHAELRDPAKRPNV
jgi:hypothetical protein